MKLKGLVYTHSALNIPAAYSEGHGRYWYRLANPGNWFTGQQRVDMAKEVRQALDCTLCADRKQALSPAMVQGEHNTVNSLPKDVVEVVHRVTTDPNRLTRKWFDDLMAAGLTPEAYVEILGVALHVFMIDEFCRAVGHPLHALPQPVAGDPAGQRPANTIDIGAWVEVLPFQIDAALPEADLSGKIGFNVFRGLSLSPDDVRTVIDLIAIHYLSGEEIGNFREGFRGTLDRYQKEVIATRVSAANECFYCTSGHAAMLSTSAYQTKNEIIDMTGLTDFDAHLVEAVPNSRELIGFCDAFTQRDDGRLSMARKALAEALGLQAVVEASGIVSNFQRMNRIANATGIPIDPAANGKGEERRNEMNSALGISSYPSAQGH